MQIPKMNPLNTNDCSCTLGPNISDKSLKIIVSFFYEIFLRYHDSLIYVFAKIRMIINLMVFEEVLFSNFAAVFLINGY